MLLPLSQWVHGKLKLIFLEVLCWVSPLLCFLLSLCVLLEYLFTQFCSPSFSALLIKKMNYFPCHALEVDGCFFTHWRILEPLPHLECLNHPAPLSVCVMQISIILPPMSLEQISDGTLERVALHRRLTYLTELFILAFNSPSLSKAKLRSKMAKPRPF